MLLEQGIWTSVRHGAKHLMEDKIYSPFPSSVMSVVKGVSTGAAGAWRPMTRGQCLTKPVELNKWRKEEEWEELAFR